MCKLQCGERFTLLNRSPENDLGWVYVERISKKNKGKLNAPIDNRTMKFGLVPLTHIECLMATFDYVGQDDNELTLHAGDKFILLHLDEAGWMYVEQLPHASGIFGVVPTTHLGLLVPINDEEYEDEDAHPNAIAIHLSSAQSTHGVDATADQNSQSIMAVSALPAANLGSAIYHNSDTVKRDETSTAFGISTTSPLAFNDVNINCNSAVSDPELGRATFNKVHIGDSSAVPDPDLGSATFNKVHINGSDSASDSASATDNIDDVSVKNAAPVYTDDNVEIINSFPALVYNVSESAPGWREYFTDDLEPYYFCIRDSLCHWQAPENWSLGPIKFSGTEFKDAATAKISALKEAALAVRESAKMASETKSETQKRAKMLLKSQPGSLANVI